MKDQPTITQLVQTAIAREYELVRKNIEDPRTDPKKKRRIVLTIEIDPIGETEVFATSKLVPIKSVITRLDLEQYSFFAVGEDGTRVEILDAISRMERHANRDKPDEHQDPA